MTTYQQLDSGEQISLKLQSKYNYFQNNAFDDIIGKFSTISLFSQMQALKWVNKMPSVY